MQEHISHNIILSSACAAAAGSPAAKAAGQVECSVVIDLSHPARRADIPSHIGHCLGGVFFICCQGLEKIVQLFKKIRVILIAHTTA